MKVVGTIIGLVDRERLQLAVLQRETPDGLLVVAEWRLRAEAPGDQCVKRDGHVVGYATPGQQAEAKLAGVGMVVDTARGLIPRDQLQVSVIVDEIDNAVNVSTEWRVKAEGPDAPHVRRDSIGIALATPETQLLASMNQLPIGALAQIGDVTIGLTGTQTGVEQQRIA